MGNLIESKVLNELYSMARLQPKRSGLRVPLFIDDGELWKHSGHWKRIKFKQNNQVDDPRNWVSMDFDGNIIDRNNSDISLNRKDVAAIRNFVLNNRYALENMSDDKLDFGDFLEVMIRGGDVASKNELVKQREAVDRLLRGEKI